MARSMPSSGSLSTITPRMRNWIYDRRRNGDGGMLTAQSAARIPAGEPRPAYHSIKVTPKSSKRDFLSTCAPSCEHKDAQGVGTMSFTKNEQEPVKLNATSFDLP